MIEFIVDGDYPVGFTKNKGVKKIGIEYIEPFGENDAAHIREMRGCYVFALRKQRATIPYYIGKATKNFGREIFTDHKLVKYNDVLHTHTFGTPLFYFVVHPFQPGKPNESAIDAIETYLIQPALIVNPELRNIQKTQLPSWTIRNIIDMAPGRSKKCEKDFADMLRLL